MNEESVVLSRIMEEHGQSVWAYLFSMSKDSSIADDLAQEVFIQAYTHLHQFRHQSTVKTWLFAIAKNKFRDHYKSAFVRRVTVMDLFDAGTEDSLEEQVVRNLECNEVWDAVMQLKREAREIVVLHVKEELTFAEIGDILGMTEGTARVKYHRAVKQLRTVLGREMMVDGISGHA